MADRRVAATVILVTIAALVMGGSVYYRWKFPYGYSHCCLVALDLALNEYAADRNGWFPAGESSPEASLCLLYRVKKAGDAYGYVPDPELLRGMTVPTEKVRAILESGRLLGPDTCGWHYVEGLTYKDDRIAILWPKVALGHNGGRHRDGGRQVLFANCSADWVTGDQWPAFLEEQAELLRQRLKDRSPQQPTRTGR